MRTHTRTAMGHARTLCPSHAHTVSLHVQAMTTTLSGVNVSPATTPARCVAHGPAYVEMAMTTTQSGVDV